MTKPFIAHVAVFLVTISAQAADPLPSWKETAPKLAITDFVPPAERIAVFDNGHHEDHP